MKFETTIVDDDGVAVIASASALKERYANRAFDYTLPNALLEGMNAHELFAWQTGFEGEHTVYIEVVNEPPDSMDATPAFGLSLREGLLIMPYSHFTMGCDNHGTFDMRLATLAPIPPGDYRVSVTRIATTDDGSVFRICVAADHHHAA